ncbi:hypothetical protein M9H77_18071 [Catharanthus roseus]|uniref:Uncharacterized protein n=1 Tax=Catharanthus roseus TaxID=4058 RepID=A0ACC0B6G5_CATRO|nr:hypothetical protein M9H77_18071 [Catharanthus roseus]
MIFFIEFSIPWVWKWTPEVSYTPQNLPCLKRVTHSRFWDRLIKINPDTNQIHGQNILNEIHIKNDKYQTMKEKGEIKEINPFHHIATKLKLQKEVITKEDLIRSYMEELKKDLVKNLVEDNKSDMSMTGSSNEDCLAGESQDPNMEEISEEDIDQMAKEIEQQAREEIFQKTIV